MLYVNQWQRGIPSPELVDYFLGREPAHIVRSGGLELARIYDVRNEAPPAFLQIVTASAANFGDRMRLAGYHLEQQSLTTGAEGLSPGDRVMITLYLRKLADAGIAYDVLLRLVGPDGVEIWRDEGWSAADLTPDGWPEAEVVTDDRELVIPDDAAPGHYKLMLSFYDPRNGELLPAAGGGVSHEVTSFEVKAPGSGAPSASSLASGSSGQSGETDVSPQLRARELDASWVESQLTALQHAPQMTPGQTLRVELAVKGRADESRKFSARLVDPAGTVKAQTDVPLRPLTRIDLDLPADAKPGIYKLVVVLYDSATLEPFADSTGNFVTALSEVEVVDAAAR